MASHDGNEEGSDGNYESDCDASSISSWSESEMPDLSFAPMPAMCKAWKEHWDPTVGKVLLSGDFGFTRLEDDTAIFQLLDCAPEFKDPLIDTCKRTAPPDVTFGNIVHDVETPELCADWPALTLTCPWRALIGRVLAEELRVDAYRARVHPAMMTAAKRARRRAEAAGGEVDMATMMRMLDMSADASRGAYVAVRSARRGRADRVGDERLETARQVAAMRAYDDDDDDEEE
ncbi:hypothetical protein B0H19DRAFT_1080164 [Mycena capillaripes]|nr:hypothetical protein B0H19DRAFT_1080164 [Mycena capillaripes]